MFQNEITAVDLFSSLGFFSPRSVSPEAQRYLEEGHSRQETLLHIAHLCTPPHSKNELYIVAYAYLWAGAQYRNEAIKWLRRYIKAGASNDYTPDYVIKAEGYSYSQKDKFAAIAYVDLSNAYEHEYLFDEALSCLYSAQKIAPYLVGIPCDISRIYIKQGCYYKAISFLLECQTKDMYNVNPEYKQMVDTALHNAFSKQKRGYVYRPRKK